MKQLKNLFLDFKIIFTLPVIIVSLGYFVDIFDLTLFNMLRNSSLINLGVPLDQQITIGISLLNWQMAGMLFGGIFWGILADKKGRISVLFGSIFLYSIANILNAFVQNIPQYSFLRFFSGLGLAGELGAGITLISELLPKEKRGLGTALVATIGVLGACVGGLVVEFFNWKFCYILGGVLGLLLLALRFKIKESIFFNSKSNDTNSKKTQWGNFLSIFTSTQRFKKFILCILIGIPIWYIAGLLMAFAPELSKELGVLDLITASRAIGISYLGLALGDFTTGFVSQILKSRKKTIQIFLILTLFFISLLFLTARNSHQEYYYSLCFLIGFGAGFWALFVTVAAEQFGTNIRGTVATSVPNFVRGSVIPMTLLFKYLKPQYGVLNSVIWIGLCVFIFALFSSFTMTETFNKDLDYLENE